MLNPRLVVRQKKSICSLCSGFLGVFFLPVLCYRLHKYITYKEFIYKYAGLPGGQGEGKCHSFVCRLGREWRRKSTAAESLEGCGNGAHSWFHSCVP